MVWLFWRFGGFDVCVGGFGDLVCFAAGGWFVDSVDFRVWLIVSRFGLVRLVAGDSGAFLGDFGGLRWVFRVLALGFCGEFGVCWVLSICVE